MNTNVTADGVTQIGKNVMQMNVAWKWHVCQSQMHTDGALGKNQNWNWLTALGFYSHTILKCTQMTKNSMLMTWKSSESSG